MLSICLNSGQPLLWESQKKDERNEQGMDIQTAERDRTIKYIFIRQLCIFAYPLFCKDSKYILKKHLKNLSGRVVIHRDVIVMEADKKPPKIKNESVKNTAGLLLAWTRGHTLSRRCWMEPKHVMCLCSFSVWRSRKSSLLKMSPLLSSQLSFPLV